VRPARSEPQASGDPGWRIKERVEEFSYSFRLMQLMQPPAKKK
jgi:hypothetical protein